MPRLRLLVADAALRRLLNAAGPHCVGRKRVRREHLQHLVCPSCKGQLTLEDCTEDSLGISSGRLRCVRCSAGHPIHRYVPRFVPEHNYASGFGLQWTKHAQTQHDAYTGVSISEKRFFQETRWPRRLDGEVILEVGSGSGRFTAQAASTGALVVSMDYSVAADANHAANGRRPNVLIVQADLYQMPFRAQSFDRVFCFGVLQHTPDVHRSFLCISEMVRDSGRLVVDVYRKLPLLKHLFATKYWIRPLTRRLPPKSLYAVTRAYVKFMWPITRMIHAIPVLGSKINWRLLVPDYRGIFPLSEALLREWAILDAFDMLSPAYDNPQKVETVRQWFEEAGFNEVEVHYGHNGIEGRGVKLL